MTRRYWTEVEIELLLRNYANSRTEDIAAVIGRSVTTIYQKAAKLGLLKSQAYLDSPDACRLRRGDEVGKAYRFDKGHVPANKGLRRPGWSKGRMRETQFQKGRPAHEARNYLPIGSHRLSKDGYLERKVTDDPTIAPARRWICVHRLVWIEANGPLPDGHVISFRPGRRTAELSLITVDALELISRGELAIRNHPRKYGPEFAKVTQLRGVLTRQINRKAKEAETT